MSIIKGHNLVIETIVLIYTILTSSSKYTVIVFCKAIGFTSLLFIFKALSSHYLLQSLASLFPKRTADNFIEIIQLAFDGPCQLCPTFLRPRAKLIPFFPFSFFNIYIPGALMEYRGASYGSQTVSWAASLLMST